MKAGRPRAFEWQANRPKAERDLVREYMRLAQYEPRLLVLLTDIMAAQPSSDQWYVDGWKGRVCGLAGFGSVIPELKTMDAYDKVYELCFSYCYDRPPRRTA